MHNTSKSYDAQQNMSNHYRSIVCTKICGINHLLHVLAKKLIRNHVASSDFIPKLNKIPRPEIAALCKTPDRS